MSIFDGLNESQKQVVEFTEGRLVVPATAGSGKTKCVVHWIANLIQNHKVDPEKILATTFTKKGAGEMNDRLKSMGIAIGDRRGEKGIRVGTYHSLCYDILHDSSPWEHYRFDNNDDMHKALKQEILGFRGMNWADADLTLVEGYISYCHNELVSPEESKHPYDHRFDQAYQWYEEIRHERQLINFDAMLFHACQFFETDRNAKLRWADKYQYVVVDEMQDTNRAQWYISEILGAGAKAWLVVGDVDQAIFSWRGARPERLNNFPSAYQAKVITVDTNYRSRPEIVEAANKVISHNVERIDKKGIAHRKPGGNNTINFYATSDMDAEAKYVYDRIMECKVDGKEWKDFVILYRTNAQSRAFEEVFIHAKIPYYIEGGIDFWQRREIKDLIAYLKVIACEDSPACRRVINVPFRYIGKVTLEKIVEVSEEQKVGFFQAVQGNIQSLGLNKKQVMNLEKFINIIKTGKQMLADPENNHSLTEVLQTVISETDYYQWIQRDQGSDTSENSRMSNIRELLRTLNRFNHYNELFDYLSKLDDERKKRKSNNADVVRLMSIHKSKGLEFPIVFLAGVVEDILPHHKTVNVEEERRLFFVAITRAMDRLFITSPISAFIGTNQRDMQISRFIKESGIEIQPPVI